VALLCSLAFVLATTLRVWGIGGRFWLLGDQIRDWRIALGPLTSLPLVGPATHVNGYTIGPAFYWILWLIRVLVGPWFDNLPHAGGIGQALLQSAADALLLVAIWRRTGSAWIAGTVVVLLVTAGYDRALSALVWNPVVGSTLAKAATALVLLEWHRGSPLRAGLTAALAWSAVHAYTGAIYVCVSVLVVLLVDPLVAPDGSPGDRSTRRTVARNVAAIALAIVLLQLPYMAHQVRNRFGDSAMGAVTDSVGRILSGHALPEVPKSITGYVSAVDYIQVMPWTTRATGWLLLACGAIVAVRYRRDPLVLCMTLLPQAMAMAGYSLFLAALDHYYYLSLMPAAVMTVILALAALPPVRLRTPVAAALCVGALALVPARLRFAATQHVMPEYRALVDGSRTVARRGQPMRAIQTEFPLRPTGDPEFLYTILGGRIDRAAPWTAVIGATGDVAYRQDGP
jgi:hypothetical protein